MPCTILYENPSKILDLEPDMWKTFTSKEFTKIGDNIICVSDLLNVTTLKGKNGGKKRFVRLTYNCNTSEDVVFDTPSEAKEFTELIWAAISEL